MSEKTPKSSNEPQYPALNAHYDRVYGPVVQQESGAVETELPSEQALLDSFIDKRQKYENELAQAESVPGFRRTYEDKAEIAGIKDDIEAFNEEWSRYGGEEIDAAQAKIDALNFKSTAEDHIYAKAELKAAKDAFYTNFKKEYEEVNNSAEVPAEPASGVETEKPATYKVGDEVKILRDGAVEGGWVIKSLDEVAQAAVLAKGDQRDFRTFAQLDEYRDLSDDAAAAAKADANGANVPSTFASPAKNPAPAEKPRIGAAGEAWQIKRGIRPGRGSIEERRIVPHTSESNSEIPETETDTPSLDAAAAAAAVANAEAAGKAPVPKTEATPEPASDPETTPEKAPWRKRMSDKLGASAVGKLFGAERRAEKRRDIAKRSIEYEEQGIIPTAAQEKAKKDYKNEKLAKRVESVKSFVEKHKLSEEDKAAKQAQIDRNKAARQARKDAGETKFGKVKSGYVAFRERGRERFGVNPTPDGSEVPADETPTDPIPAQEKPVVYNSNEEGSVTSPMDEATQAYSRPARDSDAKAA